MAFTERKWRLRARAVKAADADDEIIAFLQEVLTLRRRGVDLPPPMARRLRALARSGRDTAELPEVAA